MRYSHEEKQAALAILDKQGGNISQTSAATGIPADTLRRWLKQRQQAEAALLMLDETVEALRERTHGNTHPGSPDKVPLLQVHDQMLSSALMLAESLREGIQEAPLSHRANALNQLLDKIMKMTELLPQANEQVIRIEYLDPDGSLHPTPYWARDDSEA